MSKIDTFSESFLYHRRKFNLIHYYFRFIVNEVNGYQDACKL